MMLNVSAFPTISFPSTQPLSTTEIKQSQYQPTTSQASDPKSAPRRRISALEATIRQSVPNTSAPIVTETTPQGPLISDIHARLIDKGWNEACHHDDNALILSTSVGSEHEQKRLVRATIGTANRFAIITSYGIRPLHGANDSAISSTMVAVLEAIAARQGDENFSFVFLYNKSSAIQNFFFKKTTNISMNASKNARGVPSWPQVVEAYNAQQQDKNLRITNLKSKIYLVAAESSGLGDSYHNKFCINDAGMAATLGASIGNMTKENWFDGGCITLSQALASSQRDYFCDRMLGPHSHFGLLATAGGKVTLERLNDPLPIRQLKDIPVVPPLSANDSEINSELAAQLEAHGMPSTGGKGEVLWLQNSGRSLNNMVMQRRHIDSSPIGFALHSMFNRAKPGDTIKMFHGLLSTEGVTMLLNAISRGVNVTVLKFRGRLHAKITNFESLQKRVDKLAESNTNIGKLTIKNFSPDAAFCDSHRFQMDEDNTITHGKIFILDRVDQPPVVLVGTFNLTGQSQYRSHENMMLVQTDRDVLASPLFDNPFDASGKGKQPSTTRL